MRALSFFALIAVLLLAPFAECGAAGRSTTPRRGASQVRRSKPSAGGKTAPRIAKPKAKRGPSR